jgi:TetR/AcrR family transcriptional regulator
MEARSKSGAEPELAAVEADDGTSRAARKAQSRRRILEAARDVFFRDGFMAANLDEVAEKAGVAKGTLYRYFASKADLYVAVLADNGTAFTERMREEAGVGGGSTMDQLRRISRFYYDYWSRHPEYFQIFWAIDNQEVIGELPEAVVAEVTRLWENSLEILARVLREGIDAGELRPCDPWEVANILWTTSNALIQSDATKLRRQLRRMPLEAVFRDALELIFAGLTARPAGS